MGYADPDIQKGREALIYFHNEAAKFQNYNLTFDELLNQVSKGKPDIFLEGLGLAINSINSDGWFGMGKVQAAMINLAEKGQGRVPSSLVQFTQSLTGEAQNISWVETSKFVAVETGKQVLEGVQAAGDTVVDTLKSLNVVLPILAIGAIAYIVFQKTKSVAG